MQTVRGASAISWLFISSLALLASCALPFTAEECVEYAEEEWAALWPAPPSDQFIVFCVDARQLDYSGNQVFVQSVAKHPRDYSKNGDVGHAWIYVQGYMDGELVALEGGHSGEVDPKQVTYLDGVVNGALYGSVDPSKPTWEQKNFGSNPIAYLWEERTDGFFQIGSGGHWPTLAARVDLTDEEFRDVVDWLQDGYDFERYSFMDHHCCHFIIEAAQRVGLRLDASQRMVFDQDLRVGGVELRLWEDAYYSEAILASPDALERCLEQEIELGELEDAMDWYVSKHRKEKESPTVWLKALPQRVARWWALR